MKKLFTKFLCLLLMTMWANASVFAQTTVSGKVTDDATGEGIIGVNVIIKGTTTGTSTDQDGRFSLSTNTAPPFTLVFSSVGFKAKERQFTGSQSNFSISLEPDVLLGQEIIVSASRKREKIQEAPAAVSILSIEKIANDAVVNPMLSIRNLTGVNVAQYGVGGGHINLRGRSAVFQTETFIMADYRNIVLPSFGTLQYEQQPIDAIDLERVEVIRGPGSALYGPGVEAGIVHFISKDPFRHPGSAVSVYGGNQSSFGMSFRHAGHTKDEKLGYKIVGYYRSASDFEIESDPNVDPIQAARLASYPDQVVSSLNPEDVITTEVPNYDMRSYGFTATLDYRVSDKTTITGVGGLGVGEAVFRTSQGEGYTQAPRPFAQVRVQSGGFFGQAFWSFQNGADGNTFLYGTGLTTINEAHQFEGQLQYNFQLADKKLDITVGTDYRLNTIETQTTIHGRFEDDDDYSIFGGYAQLDWKATDKLSVIAAGRIDQFGALSETAFSPRVGLVYKINNNNTIRATWNRAFGAPTSINLYADLPLGFVGAAPIWLIGGAEPHSYDNGVVGELITGGTLPSQDMPLNFAYAVVTGALAGAGQAPFNDPTLLGLLQQRIPSILGNSSGVLTGSPVTRGPLELSESNMFEIGYKGIVANKLSITFDVYYNNRKNNLTAPVSTAPFIVYPGLGTDLGTAVAGAFTDAELAAFGLNAATLAAVYQGAADGIANPGGNPSPLGILVNDQVSASESVPGAAVSLAYLNIEEFDYFGIDFGLEYFINQNLSVFGNVSWVSDAYWENLPVKGSTTGTEFSLNIPDTQLKFGLDYTPNKGFYGNIAVRYNNAWRSVNGSPWTGDVDSYTLVDLGAGYKFDFGLNLGVTVTNLFDVDYQPIFGAPFVGVLGLGKVTYEFGGKK